jgi:hypothetical protein
MQIKEDEIGRRYIACGEMRICTKLEKLFEKYSLEGLGAEERIILR